MAMDVRCPWCAGDATVKVVVASGTTAAIFTCSACSVSVELAPDPVATPAARAA